MPEPRRSPKPLPAPHLIHKDDPLWARLYAFTLRTLFPVGAVGILVWIVREWFKTR